MHLIMLGFHSNIIFNLMVDQFMVFMDFVLWMIYIYIYIYIYDDDDDDDDEGRIYVRYSNLIYLYSFS